jgi:hypothetical protein
MLPLLPWLVVHGAAVWKAALAATILLALALARLHPRRAARQAAARARARLGAPLADPIQSREGKQTTLTAHLTLEGAASTRFEDRAPAAAASATSASGAPALTSASALHLRAERLFLLREGLRIELDGPVHVLAGSREARPGVAPRRLAPAITARLSTAGAVLPALANAPDVVLRSLASGDLVSATGVLRRGAAADGTDYRTPAARWSLVPVDGLAEGAAILLAFEGAPRVRGPALRRLATVVAGSVASALALLLGGGEIAFGVEEAALASTPPALPRARSAMVIAAATPLRRVEAMARLAADEDPAHADQAVALAELSGDCDAAGDLALHHGRLAAARASAERCGRPDLAAYALHATGDFEGASAALARAPDELPGVRPRDGSRDPIRARRLRLRIHLLAGRFTLAAGEARRFAALLAERRDDPQGAATPPDNGAPTAVCLADALAARGGDRAALSRLSAPRPSELYSCAVLHADLLAGRERLGAIDATGNLENPQFGELVLEVAPGLARETLSTADLWRLVPGDSYHEAVTLPAVSRALADALAGAASDPRDLRRRALARSAARAAAFALSAGRYEDARRYARLATDSVDRDNLAVAWGIAAAVEIFAGDLSKGSEHLATAEVYVRDKRTEVAELIAAVDTLHAAGAGVKKTASGHEELVSGRDLDVAHLLRPTTVRAALLARLALRRPGPSRGELRGALRDGLPADVDRGPELQLTRWATLSELAIALGEDALGAELRERARRFEAALLRRDLAVPLHVLGQL